MDQVQQISKACLNCPRCNSTNTKFCYYNNYSLSQPRHFCKACKRYWTRGGTLRNVPVGGGCRKISKRVKSRAVLPPQSSSFSSVPVDAPLSSSNLVLQIPTSTIPTASQGASNNVLTPLLFSSYNDLMIRQYHLPCNIYSDMNNNVNTNNDIATDAAFVSSFNDSIAEYHSQQNATPSSSISRNRPGELLERLVPFQTIQKQSTSTKANVHHHNFGDQQQAKRWNANHDPHYSSMYTATQTWPHNHLANMNG